jgi:two-component system sensor histidine kinase/response regulator
MKSFPSAEEPSAVLGRSQQFQPPRGPTKFSTLGAPRMADQPSQRKGSENAPLEAPLAVADSIPLPESEPGLGALPPPLWSRAEVLDRLGGDEELLRELCQIFLKESPRLMENLRQGMANGDAAALQRAAHSLKGEVSYLSAAGATQAARRLEDMGHDRELSLASEAIRLMERELDDLRQAIEDDVGRPAR